MKSEISANFRSLNHEEFLDYYTEVIDKRIETYTLKIAKDTQFYHPFIGEVGERMGEFLLRKGKRIASCSTLLTYQGYTGRADEAIMRVCLAIELYRHSILVHDDLVDMDDLRRGGKAFHKLFSNEYDERCGESIAVFYGNIFFAEALRVLLETRFDRERLLEVLKFLGTGYREVNESQVLDLLFEYKEPTLKEWEVMASKRAASLFKVNMLTGANLGGAAENELRLIAEGARHIGFSFDIQDDIIGTFASAEQYGRPTGGDIVLGKKPLHIVYAYQLAQDREKAELRRLLASRTLGMNEVAQVEKIVRNCGALEKATQRSREHAQKAIQVLDKTSMNDYSKGVFSYLINFVSESLDWYR